MSDVAVVHPLSLPGSLSAGEGLLHEGEPRSVPRQACALPAPSAPEETGQEDPLGGQAGPWDCAVEKDGEGDFEVLRPPLAVGLKPRGVTGP